MDMFDPASAALVAGGTLLATVLRAGRADIAVTTRALACLLRRPFDPARIRQRLSGQIGEIDRDGLIRAQARSFDDGEFDGATQALIRTRSVDALFAEHDRFCRLRTTDAATATGVLHHAADLAPVMGLAGTLLSLGQLTGAVAGGSSYADAIAMAVTTTLYGLVLAHLVAMPLATAIARRAAREEAERQVLVDWLARAARRSLAVGETSLLDDAA
jgi:chemotaxis protein MotA